MSETIGAKFNTFIQIYINGVYLGDDAFFALQETRNYYQTMFPLRILYIKTLSSIFAQFDLHLNRTCDVQLNVYRMESMEDQVVPDTSTQTEKIHYATYKYTGIVDLETYPVSESEQEDISTSNSKLDREFSRRIHLFSEDYNLFTQGIINNVISNVKLPELIAYAFETCANSNYKIFISPVGNPNTYEQLVIPPMGFLQFLEYVDNRYGLYETDYNVYCEDNNIYILNTDKEFKKSEDIDPINITIVGNDKTFAGTIRGMIESTRTVYSYIDDVIIDDTLSEYHLLNKSKVNTAGTITAPGNIKSNNLSHVVDNDSIIDLNYFPKNNGGKIKRYSIKFFDWLIDLSPNQTFNINHDVYGMNDMRLYSWSRLITPTSVMMNLEMYSRQ